MSYNVAIIAKNTLEAVGIKHILIDTFSITSHLYDTPASIVEHANSGYDFYFTDAESYLEYLDFFLPRKLKTIVFSNSQSSSSEIKTICRYSDESAIIDSLNAFFAKEEKNSNEQQSELSQRETDVLRLIASGLINKEIAEELNISINTVLTHRKNITAKLGIRSVSGLSFYAMMNGIIAPK